jgi:hypothetical protein
MADEARNRDKNDLNRTDARKATGGQRRDVPAGDAGDARDAGDERSDTQQGEPDDVAEDRNLSGSTTWLTLPDQQPKGEPEEEK